MKYRIKEKIDGNDESIFIVEHSHLGSWWRNFHEFDKFEQAEKCIRSLQTKEVKYHTVEQ